MRMDIIIVYFPSSSM